jgi:hypothetical protein
VRFRGPRVVQHADAGTITSVIYRVGRPSRAPNHPRTSNPHYLLFQTAQRPGFPAPTSPLCAILSQVQYPSETARTEYVKASAIAFFSTVLVSLLLSAVLPTTTLEEGKRMPLEALALREVLSGGFFGIVQLAGSIGLFAMTFAETRGERVELARFWEPFRQPWRWTLIGVSAGGLSALAGIAAWVLISSYWSWLIYYALLFLTAPFYILVLPHMLATEESYSQAVTFNLRAGIRHYIPLLKATSLAVARGWWGIVACGIGLIWTQPQYQRTITRWYADHCLEGWPAPPAQDDTDQPPSGPHHGFTSI